MSEFETRVKIIKENISKLLENNSYVAINSWRCCENCSWEFNIFPSIENKDKTLIELIDEYIKWKEIWK